MMKLAAFTLKLMFFLNNTKKDITIANSINIKNVACVSSFSNLNTRVYQYTISIKNIYEQNLYNPPSLDLSEITENNTYSTANNIKKKSVSTLFISIKNPRFIVIIPIDSNVYETDFNK